MTLKTLAIAGGISLLMWAIAIWITRELIGGILDLWKNLF
jgi:hypothetical protein